MQKTGLTPNTPGNKLGSFDEEEKEADNEQIEVSVLFDNLIENSFEPEKSQIEEYKMTTLKFIPDRDLHKPLFDLCQHRFYDIDLNHNILYTLKKENPDKDI